MKRYMIIFVLFFIFHLSYSQKCKEVTKSDSLYFEKIISKKADSLKLLLLNAKYISNSCKKLEIDFILDTFTIHKRNELFIKQDYSDYGMKKADLMCYNDYELLLNKYYKLLLSKLNVNDKELLKNSQRNWLKFRELEEKLNFEISKVEYSGGGTVQNTIVLNRQIELVRQRVCDFYDYLWRLNMNLD